jgi:hypothetical protein
LSTVITDITGAIAIGVTNLSGALATAITDITGALAKGLTDLSGAAATAITDLSGAAKTAMTDISAGIANIITNITAGIAAGMVNLAKGLADAIAAVPLFKAIQDNIISLLGAVTGIITTTLKAISAGITTVSGIMTALFGLIVTSVVSTLAILVAQLSGFFAWIAAGGLWAGIEFLGGNDKKVAAAEKIRSDVYNSSLGSTSGKLVVLGQISGDQKTAAILGMAAGDLRTASSDKAAFENAMGNIKTSAYEAMKGAGGYGGTTNNTTFVSNAPSFAGIPIMGAGF